VGTAQQRRAHHRAQIVRVLDAVAQHEEGRLALRLGGSQQVFHRGVFDLAGERRHALMALRTGHQPQLIGVHPLDGGTGLFGHGGKVGGHSRGHPLRQQHGVHAGAALEQLGHGIFTVNEALALLRLLSVVVAAGAARHFLFVHCVLLPFMTRCTRNRPHPQDFMVQRIRQEFILKYTIICGSLL